MSQWVEVLAGLVTFLGLLGIALALVRLRPGLRALNHSLVELARLGEEAARIQGSLEEIAEKLGAQEERLSRLRWGGTRSGAGPLGSAKERG